MDFANEERCDFTTLFFGRFEKFHESQVGVHHFGGRDGEARGGDARGVGVGIDHGKGIRVFLAGIAGGIRREFDGAREVAQDFFRESNGDHHEGLRLGGFENLPEGRHVNRRNEDVAAPVLVAPIPDNGTLPAAHHETDRTVVDRAGTLVQVIAYRNRYARNRRGIGAAFDDESAQNRGQFIEESRGAGRTFAFRHEVFGGNEARKATVGSFWRWT